MAQRTDTVIELRDQAVVITVTYDDVTMAVRSIDATNSSGVPVTVAISRLGVTRTRTFGPGVSRWTPAAGVSWERLGPGGAHQLSIQVS